MKVLFVCKNNQFRSQMAAAIYNQFTQSDDASSAGTYVGNAEIPEGEAIENFFQTKDFFELMEEHDMYLRKKHMRKLTPAILDTADIVISMAEEPFVPNFLKNAENVIWWDVENPEFATREISEKIFTEIHSLVQALIADRSV